MISVLGPLLFLEQELVMSYSVGITKQTAYLTLLNAEILDGTKLGPCNKATSCSQVGVNTTNDNIALLPDPDVEVGSGDGCHCVRKRE